MATLLFAVTLAFLTCFVHGHVLAPAETCTYTFNVPVNEEYGCHYDSPSHETSDLHELKEHMNNQHNLLGQQLSNIMDKLNTCIEDKEDEKSNSTGQVGTTYIHWGKKTCPDTAELIYDGFAGKSKFNEGGGGNCMCLPKDPTFKPGSLAGHQTGAYMYGVEYEVSGSAPDFVDKSLHDNDVPCAVCDVIGRTRLLTVPAKLDCPIGWMKEYQGLLMTEHYTHRQSEFLCVADDPETLDGGSAGQNGGLLYVVEAVCGSLKCPPYVNGYEFVCVVCTK